MKSLIIFNANNLSDFVKHRLTILYNEINTDKFDIYIQLPNYINIDLIKEYVNGSLTYEGNINSTLNCSKNYGLTNLLKPLYEDYLNNKSKYNEYKNFYVLDYSVYCNKSWGTLFNLLNDDKYDDVDLMMNELKISEDNSWMWTSIYRNDNEVIKDNNFKRLLSSYNGGFLRISKNGLDFYANYNNSNVKEYFIDFALPTVLYNYGYNVKSLSYVNNIKFDLFNICKSNSFHYGNNPISRVEIDKKFSDLTLFNNYNESIGIEYDHKINNPKVSIIIYANNKNDNLEKIKKCIDSALNQKTNEKYEVLFIDDSSNNNIKNYIVENKINENDNFIYIKITEYGFINGINYGIYNSNGEYIIVINAYDTLPFYRISENINFIISNKNETIDCIYNLSLNENLLIEENIPNKEKLNYNILFNNKLNNYESLFMLKDSLLNKLPYIFEEYYVNYETYDLLFNMLFNNLNVYCLKQVGAYIHHVNYNENKENLSNEALYRINHLIDFVKNYNNFKEEKNITIIVSFKDEKHEVEKTISSIRATTTNIPIIVVNDGSDDEYDYYNRLKKYKVKYLENIKSSGVAGAREDAINLIKTEYFMLLDGHMRFYEHNWDDRILKIIENGNHQNDILCAQTRCFWKKGKHLYINEIGNDNSTCFGAVLDDKTYTNNPNWTWKCYDESMKNDNLVIIPCILGACYIISKNHWKTIGGLTGLLQWGQDEPLLSIKTWLSGNKCYVIRDFYAGHLYRDNTPYNRNFADMNSNYIYLNYLFYDGDKLNKKLEQLKKHFGEQGYNNAYKSFMNRKDEFDKFKEYFDTKVKVKPIEFFDELNERCKDK